MTDDNDMDKDRLIFKVCKDSNDIFTRIFDHRPFLNGEIQHFIREFEEKKGNKDIESLLSTHQKITELNADLESSSDFGASVDKLIQSITATTNSINSVNSFKPNSENSYLLEKEETRKRYWQDTLDKNAAKLFEVENLIKEKELEYRLHYEKLEENLKINL